MIHPVLVFAFIVLMILPRLIFMLPPNLYFVYLQFYFGMAVPLFVMSILMSL
jgi:hypothetical protein